jgi:hypothetical protein
MGHNQGFDPLRLHTKKNPRESKAFSFLSEIWTGRNLPGNIKQKRPTSLFFKACGTLFSSVPEEITDM